MIGASETLACLQICFFQYVMSGKGGMAYNKAPTKEKLRKWGRLSKKGDKIKFVDARFKR